MALREILIELGIEVDPASKKKAELGIKDLKRAAVGAAAAIAAIGGAALVIRKIVNDVADLGDQMAKTSKQIGVNAQDLQELSFAANLAGASNQDLVTGLRVLSKNAVEAATGNKEFAEEFERLGIRVRDSNGQVKSGTDLLAEMQAGMGRLKTDTEKTAAAQILMGRGGTKLLPMFKQSAEAIEAQRKRAQELGEVMSEDLLKMSEDLIDAQREQKGAFQGLKNVFAEELLPTFIEGTKEFTEFIITLRPMVRGIGKAIAEWLKANRDLIRSGITRTLRFLGNLIKGLASAIKFLVVNWKAMFDVLGPIESKIWAVGTALIAMIAVLGLPVTLLIVLAAMIALVIDDLQVMADGGDSVSGRLVKNFQDLIDVYGSFGEAVREITKAAFATMLEFFGLSVDEADKWGGRIADVLVRPWLFMKHAIVDTFETMSRWINQAIELAEQLIQKFIEVAQKTPFIGDIGRSIAQRLGGGGPSVTASPAGARTSVVSRPTVIQDITIDARGATNPAAVGDEAGRATAGAAVMDLREAQIPVLTIGETP